MDSKTWKSISEAEAKLFWTINSGSLSEKQKACINRLRVQLAEFLYDNPAEADGDEC